MLKCNFCEKGVRDSSDTVYHETKDGDIACETCLVDACSHAGQILDNLLDMPKTLDALLKRWVSPPSQMIRRLDRVFKTKE